MHKRVNMQIYVKQFVHLENSCYSFVLLMFLLIQVALYQTILSNNILASNLVYIITLLVFLTKLRSINIIATTLVPKY